MHKKNIFSLVVSVFFLTFFLPQFNLHSEQSNENTSAMGTLLINFGPFEYFPLSAEANEMARSKNYPNRLVFTEERHRSVTSIEMHLYPKAYGEKLAKDANKLEDWQFDRMVLHATDISTGDVIESLKNGWYTKLTLNWKGGEGLAKLSFPEGEYYVFYVIYFENAIYEQFKKTCPRFFEGPGAWGPYKFSIEKDKVTSINIEPKGATAVEGEMSSSLCDMLAKFKLNYILPLK